MLPDNLEVRKELAEIKQFVQSKLAHVELNVKNHLPTNEGIHQHYYFDY